ncbi:MAG: hypothetical protein Q4P34_00470 [Tissierellia bacterium]|nr:hypothetical protein [Tissierellia bacterium]
MYRIIDGLYLMFSNCIYNMDTNDEQYKAFQSRGFCFYKMIEGKSFIELLDNNLKKKTAIISKGDFVNYSKLQNDIIISAKQYSNNIFAIGLMGYFDDLINSLSEINFDIDLFVDYMN